MPSLRLDPFRAWRFVAGKVSGLCAVTSPPYYVLAPALVRRLTESDLYNMVRLILPRDPALGSDRYEEAADRLRTWQRDGVVVQDSDPALYVYRQQVGTARLCGLVGRLGLDPSGTVVLPHEDVMPWPVDDRYLLARSTQADLEPILLAYSGGGAASDAVGAALNTEPWVVADTDDGGVHEVWRIGDPATIATIAADLAGRQALIADGHHRYRAYLRRFRSGGIDDGLAMLVDHDRHPLTLDAIYRTLPGLTLDTVAERLPGGWLAVDGRVTGVPHAMALSDGNRWLTVHCAADETAPDVSLLHGELLPAWGVDEDAIAYHHALPEALAAARPDRITVVLEPPRLDQVLATAQRGARLPRKATSFGPKPRVGLLFRTF